MGDVGAEVTAHDAVPGGVILLVELLLDVGGDVFLDVELLQRHISTIDRVLLHLLVHVSVLDHCFSLGCRHTQQNTNNQIKIARIVISSSIYLTPTYYFYKSYPQLARYSLSSPLIVLAGSTESKKLIRSEVTALSLISFQFLPKYS